MNIGCAHSAHFCSFSVSFEQKQPVKALCDGDLNGRNSPKQLETVRITGNPGENSRSLGLYPRGLSFLPVLVFPVLFPVFIPK